MTFASCKNNIRPCALEDCINLMALCIFVVDVNVSTCATGAIVASGEDGRWKKLRSCPCLQHVSSLVIQNRSNKI